MNSRRVFILFATLTMTSGMTQSPLFWPSGGMPQQADNFDMWNLMNQQPAPMPTQIPPNFLQNLQNMQTMQTLQTMQETQNSKNSQPKPSDQIISLDQILQLPAKSVSVTPQPNVNIFANGGKFPFHFLQFLQQQSPATTTTTTTTTQKPTTTTTTPTTTTTTPVPTTTTPKVTTWSPKLSLAEIIMLQAQQKEKNGSKKPPPSKGTSKSRGCDFNGKWYEPLSQIERGQVGDWCWGSYCNHESKVVHWDDHKCTQPTTPPTTTQDPNQYGCMFHGAWFAPGVDIENNREYGRCWGTYCDYDSRLQHYEDRCINIMPSNSGAGGMGGMSGMGGMAGMGGMGGMGGMSGMAGMAGLPGMEPLEGMAGMAGMGGMAGMPGMGGAGGAGGAGGMSNLMSMLSKKKK